MLGLWKEAHAVLSERQQHQERERATRGDSEGRREVFFIVCVSRDEGRERVTDRGKERERERESEDRTGEGGGAARDANCLLGATTGTSEGDSDGSSGRGKGTEPQ